MKKQNFILLVFICCSIITKAQQDESFSITPMQAGTINITSGKTTVNLSNEVQQVLKNSSLSATYYVLFTPVDNSTSLSVSNKNTNSFTATIQSTINFQINSSVDYVVFVKRKMVQMNTLTKKISQ